MPQSGDMHPEIKLPQQHELVASPIYRLCVAAPSVVGAVDISIDGGIWRICTREIGYWWYDWLDYANGSHMIIARARAANGRWQMSSPRELFVDILMKRQAVIGRG